MHELAGQFTPVDALSKALSIHLGEAPQSHDPIAAIEAALWSASEKSRPADHLIAEAVSAIALSGGAVDLANLARGLGLSVRRLERRFAAAVGLPPKLFSRIQRFSSVFRLLEEPSRDWVETALDCGYYDQAHLIRDCRNLAGTTPAALLHDDGDLARHFYRRFRMSHSSNPLSRVRV
jgi:AraC-like DNA-binding protein